MINPSEPDNDASRAQSGIAYVWLAGALALITSAPALLTRGLAGDDWASYYVFWTEGPRGFVHWMYEVAHVGYSIPMLLFSYVGEDTPNVFARTVGLTCHCLSGALLYRILSQSRSTQPVAALAAAFFLVTPFYVIRLTLNAAYDFFLVFYLLSYLLMNSRSRWLRWLAPVSLLFSLSLETLIALEPLRMAIVSRPGQSWRAWFLKLLPYGLAVALLTVLRLTILKKSGHYAGQYAPVHDFNIVKGALLLHLGAFWKALTYALTRGSQFLGPKTSAMVVAFTMGLFAWLGSRTFRTSWLLESAVSIKDTIWLFLLGATITLLGALPYALAGVSGDPTRSESRLLFPSQFGVLLLLATAIQCVLLPRVRAAIAGCLIAVFTLSMAHDAKWILYDGLVTGDIQRQTRAALLADPTPKLIELRFPASSPMFFRGRCLGAQDLNVAQALLRNENNPQSFVYSAYCGDFTNPDLVPRDYCPVSYLDDNRCPTHRETWLYAAAPGIPPLNDMTMYELLSDVLDRSAPATGGFGRLVRLEGEQQLPLDQTEYRPPCHRTAVRALLWLLALPKSNCDNTE